jgi:hypothetical protein
VNCIIINIILESFNKLKLIFACKYFKRTIFFLIVFTGFNFNQTADNTILSAVIYSSVQLNIGVKTNTFCFACNNASNVRDTVKFSFNSKDNRYYILGKRYSIPVKLIDCHNLHMNKDMFEMLKAEYYPDINIKINNYILDKSITNKGKAFISIMIAGVEKKYTVDFNETTRGSNSIIKSFFAINLNDFNVFPPSKFFGIIQIDKYVDINFTANSKIIQI